MARRRKAVGRGSTTGRGRKPATPANAAGKLAPTMSSPDASVEATPAKRTPRKAAPRGKWSEQQLLTSSKSVLIDSDLVKLLASSAAWSCLEENEKRQILALLPADTHPESELSLDDPESKIPPLPDSFVRYSNNWRDGIRQFQLDLQNGRYDPEWLHQAEEARKQRESGDFDSFKDREFEQFWGQKQRMDMRALAGESGRIKLGELVDAGVILVGDVWRFNFVWGKGAERIVIDKEAKVHEINNSKLTFKIPPGQRVFLRHDPSELPETQEPNQGLGDKEEQSTQDTKAETEEIKETALEENGLAEDNPAFGTKAEEPSSGAQDQVPATEETSHEDNGTVEVVISNSSQPQKRPVSPAVIPPEPKRKRGRACKVQPADTKIEITQQVATHEDGESFPSKRASFSVEIASLPPAVRSSSAIDGNIVVAESPKESEKIDQHPQAHDPSLDANVSPSHGPITDEPDEIIVSDIASPRQLVTKIIEIDGRMGKDARTANAWKEIRCYRKNQDMGGLWNLRQAWYLKQQ